MRGKRNFIRETKDWLFIMDAAKNGYSEAARIYKRYLEILEAQSYLRKQFSSIPSKQRLKYLDGVIAMEKEKREMLYNFDIQRKKARIYLDTLKREKRESKKVKQ